MAGGYPGPAAGLGRGLFGDTVSPGGHKPTRVEKQLPRGAGGLSRRCAERGCPRKVQRGCGRPGPHPPPPPVPAPRTAPRTPLLPGCLPKAWRGERPQRVFSLIFTAGHLKNSLAIPRLALFVSSEFFFLFTFSFWGGEKPQNYILAILL